MNIPTLPRKKGPIRRLVKILAICAFLGATVVFITPYVLSADIFRRNLEEAVSRALGVQVQLEDYSLSWFSGFSLEGLSVPNPEGFSQEETLLELRSMRGDISLLQLLRGRLDLSGTVDGLEVRIHQNANGTTNLEKLTGLQLEIEESHSGKVIDSGSGFSGLGDLRLDLNLRDALFQISHTERGVLESLRELNCSISKEFGDADLRLSMDAKIHRPGMPDRPGRVRLTADVDTTGRRPLEIDFYSNGLDLARYQPLISMLMPPEQITALQGVVSGTLTYRYDYRNTVSLAGSLTIEEPHFAGDLFAGMDIQAPRWVINPHVEIALAQGDAPPRVMTDQTFLDLGFCQITGLSPGELEDLGRPGLGLRYELDLDGLSRLGGPIPPDLTSAGGRLAGVLLLSLGDELDRSFEIENLLAEGELSLGSLRIENFELSDLQGSFRLVDGDFQFRTGSGAALNSGSIDLQAHADLSDLEEIPLEVDLIWTRGTVTADAVRILRYAVPLLAGMADGPGLDFRSNISSELHLSGPAMPGIGESVLEWLDHWKGNGQLLLESCSFTPAPALQSMFQATGNRARLELDNLDTSFTISEGYVETALMKFESKGHRYGLQGRTSLDGTIDYSIDITGMLEGHRDGERIRKILGDQPMLAILSGSLDKPELGMPDPSQLLESALQGAVQKSLKDLLKKIRR